MLNPSQYPTLSKSHTPLSEGVEECGVGQVLEDAHPYEHLLQEDERVSGVLRVGDAEDVVGSEQRHQALGDGRRSANLPA